MNIRKYNTMDFSQLARVYQSAFAEPPWDEFKKCLTCGINYGIEEVKNAGSICKKCSNPLNLIDFWSDEEIRKDIDFANAQESPIFLVAELEEKIKGTTWGYRLPLTKFPFLKGKVNLDANYMDEIAVAGDSRRKGIGNLLCTKYIEIVKANKISEIVLRTDQRNTASMSLFSKLRFNSLCVTDPEFSWRLYLSRRFK
mgnify:CR=1 FL=1